MATQFIPIDDPADAQIVGYRNLKDRDLRALAGEDAHHGCFILEGLTVIEKALNASRHPVLSLLVAENRIDRIVPLVESSRFAGPVYVASSTVLDAIAGFPMHRGILGLGARPAPLAAEELVRASIANRRDARLAVLVGIANHDNMGGLFRNAAAFGIDAVLLDQACCDPLYRKAVRVSVGATLLVPFARDENATSIIDSLQAHGVRCLALNTTGSVKLSDVTPNLKAPMALVAGPEGAGLDLDVVSLCEPVRIPMASGFDSLNVATATGIALHWFYEGR